MPDVTLCDRSCPLQLCFRLLSHPILCGQAERRKAHLPRLQNGPWRVQALVNSTRPPVTCWLVERKRHQGWSQIMKNVDLFQSYGCWVCQFSASSHHASCCSLFKLRSVRKQTAFFIGRNMLMTVKWTALIYPEALYNGPSFTQTFTHTHTSGWLPPSTAAASRVHCLA